MSVLHPTDKDFMSDALKQAKNAREMDEVPIGAVIVHPELGTIARAHNMTETLNDPTAHAEMIAITQGAEELGDWRMEDCDLYVTVEPCSMCAGAIVQARLNKLVYGTTDEEAGACGSLYNIIQDHRLNHRAELRRGVLEDECQELMTSFFEEKRS